MKSCAKQRQFWPSAFSISAGQQKRAEPLGGPALFQKAGRARRRYAQLRNQYGVNDVDCAVRGLDVGEQEFGAVDVDDVAVVAVDG